jgi:hypothetical protein
MSEISYTHHGSLITHYDFIERMCCVIRIVKIFIAAVALLLIIYNYIELFNTIDMRLILPLIIILVIVTPVIVWYTFSYKKQYQNRDM